MTAVAYAHPDRTRSATVAGPDAASPVRPVRLLVVGTGVTGPGQAAPKVSAAVFRRRRAVAVLVLATVVVVAWLGLRALGAGPLPGPERSGAAGRVVYVVQPGDTLWSIASRLQPEGDLRPVVDRLVAARGGATLRVGERLVLPA